MKGVMNPHTGHVDIMRVNEPNTIAPVATGITRGQYTFHSKSMPFQGKYTAKYIIQEISIPQHNIDTLNHVLLTRSLVNNTKKKSVK